ncbi:hypothetical protein BJY00DRAFT_297526 [Aspergillus carlsbadensis]|nr:hypothetical protein BJY00DRAFT_297526 [Aspergillus carlsbadensis]
MACILLIGLGQLIGVQSGRGEISLILRDNLLHHGLSAALKCHLEDSHDVICEHPFYGLVAVCQCSSKNCYSGAC